jgi:Tol biopolymer transport system component
MKRAGLLLVAGLLPVVALALFPGAARPAYPGLNGRIAFVSDRDDYQGDIYTMNADGSSITRCPRNGMRDEDPAWSPDGTQIAFSSVDLTGAGGGDERDIYVMDADCGNVRRITTDHLDPDVDPTWSPDGNRIAFMRDHDDTGWDIYVRDLRTGVDTNLTHMPSADNEAPAWSPDGTRIAFESQRDNPFGEIYVMDADTGLNVTRVTDTAGSRGAVWSPDGKKIAYGGAGGVHVRDLETGETTDLNNVNGTGLAWSPDGTKFAFMSHRDGNWEIYTMDAATGDNQTRLTNHGAFDSFPDWQPLPPPPPPPGPCIVLSKTSVAISGTASTPSTRRGADSDHLTITNCGDSAVHLNARGTDATGAAGTWQLTNDSGSGSVCGVGVNVFRADVTLWLTGGQAATSLSTANTPLVGADGTTPFALGAAADQELSAGVDLPCVGSVGLGDPMTTNVTLTAVAPYERSSDA